MELHELRSFIALANEGSVSNAAKHLHVAQPTLSRQLAALEDELGQQLFIRTRTGVSLTREGHVLLRYANELIDLADKAKAEVSATSKSVVGKVHIAAGETQSMAIVARAMSICRERFPHVHFQVYSGTTLDVWDGLARGRFDLFLECEAQPHVDYNVRFLPYQDEWGVLMRCDDDLARRRYVTPDDLRGRRITLSMQAERISGLRAWAGEAWSEVEVSCNWTLPLNSRYFVREGLGLSMVYRGLFDDEGQDLCVRPLRPRLAETPGIVWRKAPLSRQAQVFLDVLLELCGGEGGAQAMSDNAHYALQGTDDADAAVS